LLASLAVRTRVAVLVLLAFAGVGVLSAVAGGWYGFRLFTELAPGSWRMPTQILDREGDAFLEVYGAEWRVTDPVVLEALPGHVANAFLAAEDVRFRKHLGIDPIGVGRAALTNVRSGGIAQGGSTITQQLAKTRFLSTERTFTRKAMEAYLALLIELRLSKDEILEAYLNDVYLGHRDGRAILGLDEGARVFFDKTPKKLTVAEAALIAGMIRAPNRDNPDERAKVARQRRDAVLGVMLQRGWITKEEHDDAIDARVSFRPGSLRKTPHPYLVAALRSELVERAGERRLRVGGLRIRTAIDPRMQRAAEAAVRGGTQRLRGRYSWLKRKDPLQAAILSVEPATGGIRALVGGSDFRKSQFDRTRRMRRQPGSAFKPFTYAAAIDAEKITAATIVEDKEVEIQLARNDVWRPQNYDERFRGSVTVREAFEKSLNTTAVRIADDVGVRHVRNVLDDAGIEGDLSDTPAIALGVDDVSMRELVGAYTIFPNLGRRTEPHLIERVESATGRTIHRFRQRTTKALDPAVAYVVHSLMRGVVQRGTASDLNHLDLGHIAGKTGTTNDYRDAWFIGYAPDLLTATWVGFDDGTPLRMSSAEAALPIWAAFMAKTKHERGEIAPPEGVHLVRVERATGRAWRPRCGSSVEEAFLDGTAPEETCQPRAIPQPLPPEFTEPPVISPEQSQAWSTEVPGLEDVQIVIDPAAGLPPENDDDPDVLDEQERAEIDRQLKEALPAEPVEPPPGDVPPTATETSAPPDEPQVEKPPEQKPPEQKPPEQKPPQISASTAVRGERPGAELRRRGADRPRRASAETRHAHPAPKRKAKRSRS
jgi:penicillin-binding protein 1B